MTIYHLFNPHELIGQGMWALIAFSLLTAPMGCFVIWRKLSYFGATLAHSALLGAILGLMAGVGVLTGVISFTVVLALLLGFWLQQQFLSSDTILGIMAHLTLAIGVILVSLMDELRIDLTVYLFGDVLSISTQVFYLIVGLSLAGCAVLVWLWRGFVNLSVQPDIAYVEGYSTRTLGITFTLLLALTVSLGMLSIGALLIISMLIIPAATARPFVRSLKQMVILTWLVTLACVVVGVVCGAYLDLPIGPATVTVAGGLFISSFLLRLLLGIRT